MPPDHDAVAVPVSRSAAGTAPAARADRTTPAPDQASAATPESAWLTPPIDIYEGPDGLVLEADLPGVPDDQLSIQLEANVLVLRGRVAAPAFDGAKVLHEEYRPGDFCRSFILSDEVDRARVSASLRNGVLRVTLPRADRARTRRIEIKSS